ncbi:Pentatricopeptide repeat-containing protein, mitochondrial [Vitis vinifera]|uniref:Pentatricopeptide repeat-containing protein, mitochondrial n=1 Tax=Vitis vinifera TaxID=29760 RepID=A0A438J3V4_VITVI|nr:Pentatricopeptide repeat-containing protein, mitochondrial [Vitis vinifera]
MVMRRLSQRSPLLLTDQNGFTNTKFFKSIEFSTSTPTSETLNFSQQISDFLKQNNWKTIMVSSHIPSKLNPDVIRAVLHQNQVGDPKRLLDFFYWSQSQMGVPQFLDSFSILAVQLCNSELFGLANGVLTQMIRTPYSSSSILDSVLFWFRNYGGSSPVVFDILIDSYKRMGMLDEAANVFFVAKNDSILISLIRCNSLLKDLLKCGMMELFWKVYNGMLDAKMGFDVHTYTYLVGALCKTGDLRGAKRVLIEMDEKGLNPNEFIYSMVIEGMCQVGDIDEAVELKRSMGEKGLVPNTYTYTIITAGLCRAKRMNEGKIDI